MKLKKIKTPTSFFVVVFDTTRTDDDVNLTNNTGFIADLESLLGVSFFDLARNEIFWASVALCTSLRCRCFGLTHASCPTVFVCLCFCCFVCFVMVQRRREERKAQVLGPDAHVMQVDDQLGDVEMFSMRNNNNHYNDNGNDGTLYVPELFDADEPAFQPPIPSSPPAVRAKSIAARASRGRREPSYWSDHEASDDDHNTGFFVPLAAAPHKPARSQPRSRQHLQREIVALADVSSDSSGSPPPVAAFDVSASYDSDIDVPFPIIPNQFEMSSTDDVGRDFVDRSSSDGESSIKDEQSMSMDLEGDYDDTEVSVWRPASCNASCYAQQSGEQHAPPALNNGGPSSQWDGSAPIIEIVDDEADEESGTLEISQFDLCSSFPASPIDLCLQRFRLLVRSRSVRRKNGCRPTTACVFRRPFRRRWPPKS